MQVFLLFFLFIITYSLHLDQTKFHEYCIIGAGPSGLQLGYFLQQSERDYIIYEKSSQAGKIWSYTLKISPIFILGSFFVDYPRHRRLISINKRYTGERNRKFNYRHDWNSLLSDDDHLRFTHRSKRLFPSADLMTDYLNDFSRHYNLRIQFNTTIQNLQPLPEQTSACQSRECSYSSATRFHMNDQNDNRYTCGYVWRTER